MKNLFRRNSSRGYDPAKYWNTRQNPNNAEGESPARVAFDSAYITRAVGDLEPVLELGPGVGRTLSAYPRGRRITTLDLSRTYAERLAERASELGLELEQHYLAAPDAAFPFERQQFPVGVASQVLLHVPPDFIAHTMSELARVCAKVVVITRYRHGEPVVNPDTAHVFNHDYFSLVTGLGGIINDASMNEGRICFTFTAFKDG